MRTTTRYALAAALASTLMGGTALAADLGGNCCADLEERIAELEATTVRKGNRKVSVQLSGFVSHNIMWWDDGGRSDTYIGDGGNYGSRFRFKGEAKINPQVTAGFLYEFAVNSATISSQNQNNGGDDLGTSGNCPGGSSAGCAAMRDSTVWLKHSQLGMVKIGQGSTATDNLILIDLGGVAGAGTSDVALYGGGMFLRNAGTLTNVTWTQSIRGTESFDTDRRNHVFYETPTLHGFSVQAAVAEDNFWDIALRYAGEFNGIRIAFGVGYLENSEFNAPSTTETCLTLCNTRVNDLKGSASIMHVPTGLFLTGAAGNREIEDAAYTGPDLKWWYISGGIAKNFFGIGNTVLFGEYSQHEGGLEQVAFITGGNNFSAINTEVTHWGIGVTQHIDAASMEVYMAYKNYSFDGTDTRTGLAASIPDLSLFLVGTRINF